MPLPGSRCRAFAEEQDQVPMVSLLSLQHSSRICWSLCLAWCHLEYGWISDPFARKIQRQGLTGGLAGRWGL